MGDSGKKAKKQYSEGRRGEGQKLSSLTKRRRKKEGS